MHKPCKILPRDVLHHLHTISLQLPDKSTEELQEILGVPDVIKLSFNESPYGPSPAAVAAIRDAAVKVNLYHDPENKALCTELAEFHGVSPDMLVMGNGADEIITLLAQAVLTSGDEAVIPVPTFGQYAAATTLAGAHPVRVPVRRDMSIDLTAVAEAISVNTKMIFLCNPNNPTGLLLDSGELKHLLAQVPANIVVVLDEAYAEYVTSDDYLSGISLVNEYSNIIAVRTFSKVFGLGGLRLGYGIAHPQLALFLNKVRNPFNINALAQAAGVAALHDREFTRRAIELNAKERERVTSSLTELGFTVYPSQTNFLLADTHRNCEPICDGLARKGIIIRPGTTWNMLSHVRISLGDYRQNSLLIENIQELCR